MHTVKLYLLDDGERVTAPNRIDLQYWDGEKWLVVPEQTRNPQTPTGHRANTIRFPALQTDKIRAIFTHGADGRTGLSEFEIWGK